MIHLNKGKTTLVCLPRKTIARLAIGAFVCGMVSGAALYRLFVLLELVGVLP